MELADRIAFAKGEKKADLLLTNAQLINVLSGRIETTQSVAVAQGRIVGLGEYPAKEVLDTPGPCFPTA
jgi:adenine deaminase